MENLLTPWEQKDWSVVDMYWNKMSLDGRLKIIETVETLPATSMKDDIRECVKESMITIIQWETWSGKTTQVPKMLINDYKRIIVTQPRVLAAISNSDRVSKEFLADSWDPRFSLGYKVWYRTWQWNSSNKISKISFHTDALELMRQFVSNRFPELLILDEVHNFSISTEFIAMMHKYKVKSKIIIMSATLDPNIFQQYFKNISSNIPVLKIPGRTHEVDKYYNKQNWYIKTISGAYKKGKNILVFAPWKKEIEETIDSLSKSIWSKNGIYPLHSDLPKEEQQKLLTKSQWETRIIVSTNIAEESITIDYIDLVVDLWTHKIVRTNDFWIQELRIENINKANCIQRAGRAGRTHKGEYIRANNTDFEKLGEFPESPIEREMLERYILVMMTNGFDVKKEYKKSKKVWEKLFFHNVSENLLNLAYERLYEIWALDFKNKITKLGRELVIFPLWVYNSRILLESIKRWCSKDILLIVSIIEKWWFLSKSWKWKKINIKRDKNSDLFYYLELFNLVKSRRLNKLKIKELLDLWIDKDELNNFCSFDWKYMLFEIVDLYPVWIKNKKIEEIQNTIEILINRLNELGIKLLESWSEYDKKMCLVSWNLHNIYLYNKKSNTFRSKYNKKCLLKFISWDVSIVKKEDKALYIATPFIIWWDGSKSDLNILTFLEKIQEEDIKPFKHLLKKKDISGLNIDFDRLNLETAIKNYSSALEVYSHKINCNSFNTNYNALDYYLKYCLPDFLIAHNLKIKKFLKWRNEKYIYTFRELLKRFILEEEKHRIQPYSIANTERRFKHDSLILSNFLNSEDPFIRKFLSWKDVDFSSLDYKWVAEKVEVPEIYCEDQNESNTKKFIELKKNYLRILGKISSNELVSVDELKKEILNRHFENIEMHPFYEKLENCYKNILDSITRQNIQDILLSINEELVSKKHLDKLEKRKSLFLQEVLRNMGQMTTRKKNLSKLQKRTSFVLNIIWNIEKLEKDDFVFDENLMRAFYKFKYFDEQKRKYFFEAIELVSSGNLEKKSVWIKRFESFIPELQKIKNNLEKEISKELSYINLESIPFLRDLNKFINKLFIDFFDLDYYNSVLYPKIFNLSLDIVRDSINKRVWVKQIIIKFILKSSFSKIKDEKIIKKAILISKYEDLLFYIENYKNYKDELNSLEDISVMELLIEWLEQRVAEYSSCLEEIKRIN